jgi:hypothetical protein
MKLGFRFMIGSQEADQMRIVVGSDHAGFEMKKRVVGVLLEEGDLEVVDVGSFDILPPPNANALWRGIPTLRPCRMHIS